MPHSFSNNGSGYSLSQDFLADACHFFSAAELFFNGVRVRALNLTLRILVLMVGMFLATVGIALVTLADLGTTPISTVPYVFSAITGYSFGLATFVVNLFFVLGQVLLLRKKFPLWNILQVPLVAVFGFLIDVSMHLFSWIELSSYWEHLCLSMTGNAVLALGVLMQVRSKTLVQPGEGFVLAVSVTFRRAFSSMKIANDVSLVIIALAVGYIVLGHSEGVREGTLISAVAVGLFIKAYEWVLARFKKEPLPQDKEPNTLFEKGSGEND